MTDKKQNILKAALELFANEGYSSTSTNKIAKKAKVSEGLIFRHFANKEGLLNAIIQYGEERAKIIFADIVFETDPQKVIEKTICLSGKIRENEDEAMFWKLQYKVKWEIERYGEQKMEALEHALTKAFNALGYECPEMEARILVLNIDGIATRYFLQKTFDLDAILLFLKKKYKV